MQIVKFDMVDTWCVGQIPKDKSLKRDKGLDAEKIDQMEKR
jgi:hypothetical protein